jgi:hypothetical protein
MTVPSEQYSSARQIEYKSKATFRKDRSNNKHLSTLVTQQYTNFVLWTNRKVLDMVIATVKHLGSSYRPGHCWRRQSKSPNTHLVKLVTTVSNTESKSTRDASYLFLVYILGRGTTYLSRFWNTLPALDFTIFVKVACRVFRRDNRTGHTYSCCLLAPHLV